MKAAQEGPANAMTRTSESSNQRTRLLLPTEASARVETSSSTFVYSVDTVSQAYHCMLKIYRAASTVAGELSAWGNWQLLALKFTMAGDWILGLSLARLAHCDLALAYDPQELLGRKSVY